MSGSLSCWSFHSVKGGVGKSTLATQAAVQLAHDHPDETVWLVDMDLTGTSLGDVLAVSPPRCQLLEDGIGLDLKQAARGSLTVEQAQAAIQVREEHEDRGPVGLPFLNDYLLFATEDWDEEHDARLDALAWSPAGASAPPNLHVLPSSALPRDLDQTLPVIFDEEHAGFLENRLEYLLAAMICEAKPTHVVFDVPPTIPGLSRAVISLALRLGLDDREKIPLSLDGRFFPGSLELAPIRWRAVMMTTLDIQDVRAMARWLDRVRPLEEPVFRVLFNRTGSLNPEQHRRWLDEVFERVGVIHRTDALEPELGSDPAAERVGVINRLLAESLWLEEDLSLAFFRRSGFPAPHPKVAALLEELA